VGRERAQLLHAACACAELKITLAMGMGAYAGVPSAECERAAIRVRGPHVLLLRVFYYYLMFFMLYTEAEAPCRCIGGACTSLEVKLRFSRAEGPDV
jgi:hypothetical protein